MNPLIPAIVSLLSNLPVDPRDPPEPDRDARMRVIAEAEADAVEHATCTGAYEASDACTRIVGDPLQLAAEIYTQGLFESSYWYRVHLGECLERECDPSWQRMLGGGRVVVHNARTPWQLHKAPRWSDEYWASLLGVSLEATREGAWAAAKLLVSSRRRCGGSTEGAFGGYATGGGCFHVQAHRRALAAAVVREKLAEYIRKAPPE